jgi:hypothetical protein
MLKKVEHITPVSDSKVPYKRFAGIGLPVGTVFQEPNGCMWRIADTRGHNGRQFIRMSKPSPNGWVFKAGEEQHLTDNAPEVWRKGTLR